jgi:hypothetical protein
MCLSDDDKRAIICKVRRHFFGQWWRMPTSKPPISMACLYWAAATVRVLRGAGLDAQLQAGSCFWPVVDEEVYYDRDFKGHRNYGYEFDPDHPFSRAAVLESRMPEMHCWAAVAGWRTGNSSHVIDVTPRYWPEHAALAGVIWPGRKPPPFLWVSGRDRAELQANWPDSRIYYRPVPEATALAYNYLDQIKQEFIYDE